MKAEERDSPLKRFEEEDIDDEVERDLDKKIREQPDTELDKNQVLPANIGKAGKP